jgi:hypothetical protein
MTQIVSNRTGRETIVKAEGNNTEIRIVAKQVSERKIDVEVEIKFNQYNFLFYFLFLFLLSQRCGEALHVTIAKRPF